MNPRLIELLNEKNAAKAIYDGQGMNNAANRTPEEQVAADLSYRRAYNRWLEAETRYRLALDEAVSAETGAAA